MNHRSVGRQLVQFLSNQRASSCQLTFFINGCIANKYIITKFYSHNMCCDVQQVQKRTARKLFDAGVTIYLQSCKMRFDNICQFPMAIDRRSSGGLTTFNQICRDYTWHNCDYIRGYYPRYYVKVSDLQN